MTTTVLPVAKKGGELAPSQVWSYSCHKCTWETSHAPETAVTLPADYQVATSDWLPVPGTHDGC